MQLNFSVLSPKSMSLQNMRLPKANSPGAPPNCILCIHGIQHIHHIRYTRYVNKHCQENVKAQTLPALALRARASRRQRMHSLILGPTVPQNLNLWENRLSPPRSKSSVSKFNLCNSSLKGELLGQTKRNLVLAVSVGKGNGNGSFAGSRGREITDLADEHLDFYHRRLFTECFYLSLSPSTCLPFPDLLEKKPFYH